MTYANISIPIPYFPKVVGNLATDSLMPSQENWESETHKLLDVLNKVLIGIPSGLSSDIFWSYPSDQEIAKYTNAENFNIVKQQNGISVSFDTIHGVKGQTHDATLVLETKFKKSMDLGL